LPLKKMCSLNSAAEFHANFICENRIEFAQPC